MVPESHPEAKAATITKNVSMSLTIASADHNEDFCQVGGESPVTKQFYEEFATTGHGICAVFKEESWDDYINVED